MKICAENVILNRRQAEGSRVYLDCRGAKEEGEVSGAKNLKNNRCFATLNMTSEADPSLRST